MSDHPERPHTLRAALENPPLERQGWQSSLAPQLIGLFLWIAFFDQIPQEALRPKGIAWPVLGAAIGSLLCYVFLYRSPAMWGMTTGRPLDVIATSTFGVKGATWVPGLLLAGLGVVWLAVSTDYATVLSLRGLVLFGMLDPKYLNTWGGGTPSVLCLVTSFLWCYVAALVGWHLVRVIAALMNVFSILPALMLGVTTILAFPGLRGYHAAEPFDGEMPARIPGGVFSAMVTVQMIFGFFATSGLISADWGTVARDAKDVKAAGWVGVALGSWVAATLAILTTAGAASLAASRERVRGPAALVMDGPWRYSAALESLVGGRLAGVMLVTFGLAALGFACYASFIFTTRLTEIWPRVARRRWTILGVGLAWIMVSTGLVNRMFHVFSLVGGLAAPAVGALAADYVRSRGVWPGPRVGYNVPGLIAWVAGSLLGVTPLMGRVAGLSRPWLESMQPAAVFGFLLAFLTYTVLAWLGMESASDSGVNRVLRSEPPIA